MSIGSVSGSAPGAPGILIPVISPTGRNSSGNALLRKCVDEKSRHDPDLVHLFVQKKIAGEGGNGSGFGESRLVAVGELGHQLPAGSGDELRGFTSGRDKNR